MRRRTWLILIGILIAGVALLVILPLLIDPRAGDVVILPPPDPDMFAGLPTATLPPATTAPPPAPGTPDPPPDPASPTATTTPEGLLVSASGNRIAELGLYVVQSGDTLWDIALDFGVTVDELIAINPDLNPDLLHPDDVLAIPGYEGALTLETPLPDTTVSPDAAITAYVDAAGGRLLLYQMPNSTAPVLALLAESAPLRLLGRTTDNTWLEVSAVPSDLIGWVRGEWVNELIPLEGLPVTGTESAATPTLIARPTVTAGPTPVAEATSAFATATRSAPAYVSTYPYISGITDYAREIFRQGQLFGNRADVFSKVGDSITANEAFLFPVGMNGYNLREHDYLQEVVDFYLFRLARDHNSFANTSLAAKGGWLVWHVLIARYADQSVCRPEESPLQCEYRTTRPAVALIMLGTNDVLTTQPGVYEEGIRRVIQTSIDYGVIPVVSTIPPFLYPGAEPGRVEELNAIVRNLTAEYEVPLWDYWAAVQDLPNYGLAGDGVHPSWARPCDFTPENLQYGMAVRNLTALQALDALYRLVILPETGGG